MIRAATLADIPAITDCAQAAYEPYVIRMGRKPAPMLANFAQQLNTHFVMISEYEQSLTGYVVYQAQTDYMLLESVAVHPTHTGRGIGRALINHVESATAAHPHLLEVELYTNEAMTENLFLYPRLGYRETKRLLEDGFERVYFRKSVAQTVTSQTRTRFPLLPDL